jgi:hypothetical protein
VPLMPREDNRHYLIGGERVVRVSTVLGVINKPGLLHWYGKHGAEECRRLSKIATDFGTRFHAAMELHALGKPLMPWELDADIAPHVAAAQQWFDDNVLEVVGIERRVHSRAYGYAGTADLLARVRDVANELPVACDWKTSKEVSPEYRLQLSAYLEAAGEDGVALYGRMVLQAPREQPGVFLPHVLPDSRHAIDYGAFLHALKLWRVVDEYEREARREWARRKRAQERAARESVA